MSYKVVKTPTADFNFDKFKNEYSGLYGDYEYVNVTDYIQVVYYHRGIINRLNFKIGVGIVETNQQFDVRKLIDLHGGKKGGVGKIPAQQGYYAIDHLSRTGRYLGNNKELAWQVYQNFMLERVINYPSLMGNINSPLNKKFLDGVIEFTQVAVSQNCYGDTLQESIDRLIELVGISIYNKYYKTAIEG